MKLIIANCLDRLSFIIYSKIETGDKNDSYACGGRIR